jgi:hypothetical protein
MIKNKDFAIFILTHGRPNKVLTYKSLMTGGCTYPIYFIVDNEDKTLDEYYKNFGKDKVIMFDKIAVSKTFDTADNFDNRKCIVFARNACFDIAKKLGYKYFLQLDDDYTDFRYKFNSQNIYHDYVIHKNLNKLFDITLNFYKSTNFLTLSYAQGGDFIGGKNGTGAEKIYMKRKAMNTFFCCVDRPFQFIGRINEDVNTYASLGMRGHLIGQINNLAINQLMTQSNSGGMTETYLDGGTYIKSFYTVLFAPSCTSISLMGAVNPRLHHKIKWDNAVPKIIDEKYIKH